MQRLVANAWPGKVRELFHVLERAAVICAGEVIDVGICRTAARRRRPGRGADDDDDLSLHVAVAEWKSSSSCARSNARETARRRRACSASAGPLYAKLEEHGLGRSRSDGTD